MGRSPQHQGVDHVSLKPFWWIIIYPFLIFSLAPGATKEVRFALGLLFLEFDFPADPGLQATKYTSCGI